MQVGEQLARRALERAATGDFTGGWRDLDEARQLAGETADWQRLQQAVADVAVGDIVQHLEASDFPGAASRLDALDKRKMPGVALQTLREVTKRLESARKLSQRGKFAEAEEQLAAAAALRPDLKLIDDKRQVCRERAERSRVLHEQLHAAIAASRLDEGRSPAPASCWKSRRRTALPATPASGPGPKSASGSAIRAAWAKRSTGAARRIRRAAPSASPRLLTVQIKRAAPLHALDRRRRRLSRLPGRRDRDRPGRPGHARSMCRFRPTSRASTPRSSATGEGYVLEPLGGKVVLDGKPVTEPALLSDGDEIVLGEAVKLRFRKPHVLSSSARLEIISRHRTLPYADAVILMAESCVLGPKWQNHVVCRDWNGDVVLYRTDDKIMCRAMESIEIDGQLHDGRGTVRPGSHVVGTDFSLSLEAV